MAKKQSNFRLSDEAKQIIAEQSAKKGMTETAFLEMIVREHRASDNKENQRRREVEWKKYRDSSFVLTALRNDDPGNRPTLDILDAKRIYFAGHNAGWIAFQLRHMTDAELNPGIEMR